MRRNRWRPFCGVLLSALVYLANPLGGSLAHASLGIWISQEDLIRLPTHGRAWRNLKSAAGSRVARPDLSDKDDPVNVVIMAKALVYARTGEEKYRIEVIDACMDAIGTESRGNTLAFGRELIAYVIAADLVGLPEDEDRRFRRWLRDSLSKDLDGRTLRSTHEDRPNNWGTHAGASRMAVAAYLEDVDELDRAARVLRGFLGERSYYSRFEYGSDSSWQADPRRPVGINPVGATKDGHSIDGVLPDDQRRGGSFSWPPPKENYVYEALQGVLAQAVILHQAGYTDVWNWGDRALLRSYQWLHDIARFAAVGDDQWQPHIINHFYRTSFPAAVPARAGKNVGWTDWTHSGVVTR